VYLNKPAKATVHPSGLYGLSLESVAALEDMIIEALYSCNVDVMPLTSPEASGTPHAPPPILMDAASSQDSDCAIVPPTIPPALPDGRDVDTIRTVRSGHTEMGISVGSLAKIRKKWIDSQQPGVSEWVDTYIWSKGFL
jgi:hypothetical protein